MPTKQENPRNISFQSVLEENGIKLGCSFTIEYRSYALTKKVSKVAMLPLRTDLSALSIPSLLSKLRGYLEEFNVVQDSKNSKVIHIIEKALADDESYALNQKISVKYSGRLAPTNVLVTPINGSETPVGGLLATIATKVDRLRGGSEDPVFPCAVGDDDTTRVTVNATNETVRSILTDYLPTSDHHQLFWCAVATKIDGEQWTLIRFFAQKQ